MRVGSTVTVGSDGSEAGLDAVGWAGEYASLWGASLRIVTVGEDRGRKGPVAESSRQISKEEHRRNQRREWESGQARARALAALSEDRVDVRRVSGDPVDALVRAAEQGPLVVGTRGKGMLSGAVAGSVSRRVMARSRGPVTVVPKTGSGRSNRVVAGVDGGAATVAVVSHALEEARVRGAELVVCRVLGESEADEGPSGPLAAAIENARRAHRAVRVSSESPTGDPVDLLVDRSADAQLVVIGSRSRGLAAGVVLGSVGQRLTVRAQCPVTVLPN